MGAIFFVAANAWAACPEKPADMSSADKNLFVQSAYEAGICHMTEGRFSQAREFFDAILETDENFLAPKLGILRSYLLEGEFSEARAYAWEIRDGHEFKTDEEIQVFNRNLETIPPAFDFRVGPIVAAGYTSNMNGGPSASQFEAYGLTFTVDEDSKPKSSAFGDLGLGGDVTFRPEQDYYMQLRGFARKREFEGHSYDNMRALSSLKFAYLPEPELELSANTFVEYNDVSEATGEIYQGGFAVGAAYKIDDNLTTSATVSLARQRYVKRTDYSGNMLAVQGGASYRLSENTQLGASLSGGRYDAKLDQYSFRTVGLVMSLQHEIIEDVTLAGNGGLRFSNYKKKEPAFAKPRRDKTYNIGASVNYRLPVDDVEAFVGPSITFARTDSNNAIFENERLDVMVQFSTRF